MLNNKGFTLVELLASLVIITLITFLIVSLSQNTFSISKNRAYTIMKNNVYKAAEDYIEECDANTISCNLDWNNNKTEFNAHKLYQAGFFKNLESPIDGKDLSDCLLIKVTKNDNKVPEVKIIDNCY